jgi:hypothetical protein
MKTQTFHKIKYDFYATIGTFIYEPILMKICMNTSTMKMHLFIKRTIL